MEDNIKQENQSDHRLSDEQKWAIAVSNKYFQLQQKDICEKLNLNKNCFDDTQKILEYGNVSNNNRNAGRPKLENTTDIKQNIVTSSACVQTNLKENFNIDTSRSTICKLLQEG